MRGRRRDALVALCRQYPAYVQAGLEPTYAPEPRTIRKKVFQIPGINNKGERSTVEVTLTTATFRLAPDCRRFYTQRMKRHYHRSHSQRV